ncbi:MAG TPA: NUDIX domain-containing protein [Aestuariivirga sp.]|nr:NUDIX domain-containing protein [Aestuariivirga sp.]
MGRTERSAGILLYRRRTVVEVFLVHPGGPFWAKKDAGSWSIPKGLYNESENPLEAAKREFREEVGLVIEGEFQPLGHYEQLSGKIITAWAKEHDIDPSKLKSNKFQMEWPPKSGKQKSFPEVDRGEWFSFQTAILKITNGQVPILRTLANHLNVLV